MPRSMPLCCIILAHPVCVQLQVHYFYYEMIDITESRLYNNITTDVITNLTTVPRLLNWF